MGFAYLVVNGETTRLETLDGSVIRVGSTIRMVHQHIVKNDDFGTGMPSMPPLLKLRRLPTYGGGQAEYVIVFRAGGRPPTPREVQMFGPLAVGSPNCECEPVCENVRNLSEQFPELMQFATCQHRVVYAREVCVGQYEILEIQDFTNTVPTTVHFRNTRLPTSAL